MTDTAFTATPDFFLREQVAMQFAFITGEDFPKSKGATKNDAHVTPQQWFGALSFVHFCIFAGSVAEAERRGLLNAVESKMCAEVLSILSEG